MLQHLFINGRFLTQQVSGVQAFARSLSRELAGYADITLLVPEGTPNEEPAFAGKIESFGPFRGHLWEQWSLPSRMRRYDNSWLLNLCNTGPLTRERQAVTIHDLAFLHHPDWFHPAFSRYYSFAIPRLVRRSPVVLTVSETVKQELCTRFNIPESRVHVVPNKVDDSLLNAIPVSMESRGVPLSGYCLMVGTHNRRKNFALAERVFARSTNLPQLVIAGGSHRAFGEAGEREISSNVLHTGFIRYGELRWLYEHATAYINPSLFEGFGLPNLEAFAFGCPVVCSDLPVFREVCGGSALYFDPTREESLATALEQILTDRPGRETRTSTGKTIFTSFQQNNRAAGLLKILSS